MFIQLRTFIATNRILLLQDCNSFDSRRGGIIIDDSMEL